MAERRRAALPQGVVGMACPEATSAGRLLGEQSQAEADPFKNSKEIQEQNIRLTLEIRGTAAGMVVRLATCPAGAASSQAARIPVVVSV